MKEQVFICPDCEGKRPCKHKDCPGLVDSKGKPLNAGIHRKNWFGVLFDNSFDERERL